MTVQLGSAYGRIEIDTSGAQTSANLLNTVLLGVATGGTATLTGAVLGLGGAIVKGVTLPITGGVQAIGSFISSGTELATSLEAQMSGVQAVMGASNEEIAELKDLVADLGVDPNLKVSSLEAASAIEMLGRNGLDVQDILDGAAKSTVLLANATGGDFAQSADIATDVMALWNIESANMVDAVDGITSVVTNSKFSVNDYALALAQGGGVAAASGVEFDDFNTSIAAISPLFASGSDAGTSFKVMLTRLIPNSEKASAAMMDLGLITEDGQNQFFDANGQMKDMAEISGLLENALSGLTEEQKNQYLATIFGQDAMRAAVGLAQTGEETFRELQGAMGETSAADNAATRMDNLAGSMEILDGIIETLKINVGDKFLPILNDLIQSFSAFLEGNQEAIVGFFDPIVSNFATLQSFASYLLQAATDGSYLNDWLLQLPPSIQPFAQSLGQIVAILRDNLGPAVADIMGILFGFSENTALAGQGVRDLLLALGVSEESTNGIVNMMEGAGSAIQDFITWLPQAIGAAGSFASGLLTAFTEGGLSGVGEFIWEWVNTAAETGPSKMEMLTSTVTTFFESSWPLVAAALRTWADKFWGWLLGSDGQPGAIDQANENLSKLMARMVEWAEKEETQTQMRDMGNSIGHALLDGISLILENTDEMFKLGGKLATGLETVFTGMLSTWLSLGSSASGGIIAGMIEEYTGEEMSSRLSEAIGDFIWGAFTLMIGGRFPTIAQESSQQMGDGIIGMWREIEWSELGSSVIDGLVDGLSAGTETIKQAATNAAQSAFTAATDFLGINSPSKLFMGVGANVGEGFALGIGQTADLPATEMVTAAGRVADAALSTGPDLPSGDGQAGAGDGASRSAAVTNIIESFIIQFQGDLPKTQEEAEAGVNLLVDAMKRRGVPVG